MNSTNIPAIFNLCHHDKKWNLHEAQHEPSCFGSISKIAPLGVSVHISANWVELEGTGTETAAYKITDHIHLICSKLESSKGLVYSNLWLSEFSVF